MSACGLHSFPSLLLKITFSCYFHFECSLVKRLLYYVFTTSVVSRSTYARCCIYCITVQPNTGCKLNSYHDVSNQRTLHNIPVCFVARTVSLLVYTGRAWLNPFCDNSPFSMTCDRLNQCVFLRARLLHPPSFVRHSSVS